MRACGRSGRRPRRAADRRSPTAAFAPRGHAVVLLRRSQTTGRTRLDLLAPGRAARPLETLVGTLYGLAPSPDGRTVLVGWGAADQWLLVPTALVRARAVSPVSRRPSDRRRSPSPTPGTRRVSTRRQRARSPRARARAGAGSGARRREAPPAGRRGCGPPGRAARTVSRPGHGCRRPRSSAPRSRRARPRAGRARAAAPAAPA